MGTTMHTHIETKKDGKWLHYGAPAVARDYAVFAAINGKRLDCLDEMLRKDIRPQASIKSLPDDMSEVTKICYEQDKESYYLRDEGILTAKDIENLQAHLDELREKHPHWIGSCDLEEDIFRTYIADSAIASHRGWDDVRIVFWYDN